MLVRYLPELLQDNENHVMSDWESSGRRLICNCSRRCPSWAVGYQNKAPLVGGSCPLGRSRPPPPRPDVSPRPTQKPSEICAVRTFFTGIKRSALINALDGRFDDHHGELARMLLDQIDTLTAQIATLTSRIERLLAAMPDKRSRGDPTTGGDRDTTARPTDAALVSRSSGSTRSPAPASRTRRPSWPRSDWTWPGSPPPRTWCRGRNCARAPFSPEW
jgi:hypothetical protein